MTRNATSAEMRAALARAFYAEKKPANAVPSRTWVNSAMDGVYTGTAWNVRDGGLDNLLIQRRGF